MPEEKFTIKDVEKEIDEILAQSEPVERAGVIDSLLERVRGRGATQSTGDMTPPAPSLPRLPRLPRLPKVSRRRI